MLFRDRSDTTPLTRTAVSASSGGARRAHLGSNNTSAGTRPHRDHTRELLRYCFDDVGLDRIIAQTMTVNARLRAVMERIGLTYVRTFRTSMTSPVAGVEDGEVEYEMTRDQWERATT